MISRTLGTRPDAIVKGTDCWHFLSDRSARRTLGRALSRSMLKAYCKNNVPMVPQSNGNPNPRTFAEDGKVCNVLLDADVKYELVLYCNRHNVGLCPTLTAFIQKYDKEICALIALDTE